MIIISESAQDQIRDQAERPEMRGLALRVAAKPDTKGGIDYALGFDEIKDDDNVISFRGFDVAISPISEDLLDGAKVDYVELEPGDFRFIFINPNDPQQQAPDQA